MTGTDIADLQGIEPALNSANALPGAFGVVLDDIDLNHVVIEDVWGADSVDWLITRHALDATPASEIAYRRALAGVAPVSSLPARRRSAIDELRAA